MAFCCKPNEAKSFKYSTQFFREIILAFEQKAIAINLCFCVVCKKSIVFMKWTGDGGGLSTATGGIIPRLGEPQPELREWNFADSLALCNSGDGARLP